MLSTPETFELECITLYNTCYYYVHIVSECKQLSLMLHYEKNVRKYEAWDTPVRLDQETSIVLR